MLVWLCICVGFDCCVVVVVLLSGMVGVMYMILYFLFMFEVLNFVLYIDVLFNVMLWLCGLVVLVVFVVMIVFCVKYCCGSLVDCSECWYSSLVVEFIWIIVLFLMFCVLFGWSLKLWSELCRLLGDVVIVYVVVK